MNYDDLSLREEILRCLNSRGKPTHPKTFRLWIQQDRINRSASGVFEKKPIQSLKTITNEISKIDSIEVIKIGGKYYRQFKKAGKLTRGIKWILALSTRLGFTKEVIGKKLTV